MPTDALVPTNHVDISGLSIIMPAYNEGDELFANLLRTLQIASAYSSDFELVVVDDGSSDNTYSEILRAAREDMRITPLQCPENCGKGNALKLGTQAAKGKYIAFLDADLDLCPSQLQGFFMAMQNQGADVVIGSKLHPDSVVEYPTKRRIISYIYYLILRVLFRLNIHDTQTGIKLFKAEIIKPVMERILVKRFAYDIEVLVLSKRRGAKIIEHPVELVFQRGSPFGRMHFRDLWYTGIDTLAIFYRLYIKKYGHVRQVLKSE